MRVRDVLARRKPKASHRAALDGEGAMLRADVEQPAKDASCEPVECPPSMHPSAHRPRDELRGGDRKSSDPAHQTYSLQGSTIQNIAPTIRESAQRRNIQRAAGHTDN
jgi:hypothetical protein